MALFFYLSRIIQAKAYRDSAIGLTLMLTVRFLPEGIVGAARESWRHLGRRRAALPVNDVAEAKADHAAPGSPRAH